MCGVEDSRLSRLDEKRVWEGGKSRMLVLHERRVC